MPNLFGIDIAGIIAKEIGPGVLPATLIVVTVGTRDPLNPSAGTQPTEVSVNGKGFQDDYSDYEVDGTIIQRGDRRVVLIANTFQGQPVPKTADKITIEGSTYYIVKVKRDPAAATYTCQVRS